MSLLDLDAVRATQRLISKGFEAYLVGGCVRDLLLGRTPKDYDIATEARPQQVKRVFPRNCRIIGRRFKLAHLHFHGNTKILECSTFRRTPQTESSEDVLITRDNEFGTAEEDALRRDFTVNALFLDPTRDLILDYTNGLEDVRNRVIRTIGDPRVRFREDPVRILRAAKFAGRLGFTVEPETLAAMAETSGDLVRSAPPRLLEEIQRLLRGGHALDSFQLLRDVGALRALVPVLADFLGSASHDQRVDFWRVLEALDHQVCEGRAYSNPVLLGALLVSPVLAKTEANPGRSASSIAEELLGPLSAMLRLPRRDAGCLKRICGVQHRFVQTDEGKRFRTEGFLHGPYFHEALELFELRTLARGERSASLEHWLDLAGGVMPHDDARYDGDGGGDAATAQSAHGGDEASEPHAAADDDGAPVEGDGAAPADEAIARDDGDGGQEHGPGRRRRRRRRRRRGRGRGGDAFVDGQGSDDRAAPPAEGADAEAVTFDDESGEPPLDANAEMDVETDADAPSNPFAAGAPSESAERADDGGDGEPGDRGRRRRRRRRRRRGGGGGSEHFPSSHEPAPHGEAVDHSSAAHAAPESPDIVRDPGAPPDGDADDGAFDGGDTGAEPVVGDERADAPADEAAGEGAGEGGGDGERTGRRRRRRRRGRRGRGDGEGGQPQQPQQQPQQQQHQRQQQPQGQRQQQHRQQQQQQQQQQRRKHRDGGDRRDRRQGRFGGPRDVDVVPRHRDRRGKVEVIEPAALDLSAFDVELDPKRVPTFGSIVEGKGRPKRRSPRVPEDGVDDYKPPPPPGGSGGAPPPPPAPADAPDTFGDW